MTSASLLSEQKKIPATWFGPNALQHAAVQPVDEHDQAEYTPAESGRDFSRVASQSSFCPVTPQRCPFGGACHTCPTQVQAKLKIGQPDDEYEREADRVADQLMRMPEPRLQRQIEPEEDEDEEELPIQFKHSVRPPSAQDELMATANDSLVSQALDSPGRPLGAEMRAFFEPRFGCDLSQVRVHTDGRAAESTRAVNARAYTVGRDVVFGAGQYAPGTHTGKNLLAHELIHVVQQKAGSSSMLQRAITEDSIEAKNGDFYSTHCGWVDTGHANPKVARNLIAYVREASQRIERREKALAKTLAAEPPRLVSETTCSASYEEGEQAESRTDTPVMSEKQHPSGAVDIFLGGFEVNGSDSAKFGSLLQLISQTRAAWEAIRGQKFGVEVWGLSDCIGRDERNNKLRLARVAAISLALSGASKGMRVNVKVDHPLTDYVASNSTRQGRLKNRGVLIRLIPQVTPEMFGTPTMESRLRGVQVSAVTPQVELTRSLSEGEVLSVALTIFAAQSTAFEHLQGWHDVINDVIPFAPPSSKFSEEDLPSNLIGFYRAARGFSIDEVKSFCGAWDKQRSVDKLKGYKFVPNPTFRAQRLPPGGSWPAELQTIVPAPFNSEAFKILRLRLQTPLFGSNCSIDANTNSVKCR